MPPPLHGAKYDDSCVQEPYLTSVSSGKQACTAQMTVTDRPEQFPDILCYLEPGSMVHGHVDWTVASATGYVSWLNLADDWDYNFRFIPANQADSPRADRGITTNNNEVGNGDATHYIELEFAASEVADSFQTPWWQGLAKLVDPLNLPELERYIHPKNADQDPVAITTGLFGLDCEHDCRSEFHPIYVLAIQLNEDPNDNVWALFARNWGDEGFCSSLNHELRLPQNRMSVLLPWPGAKGVTAETEQVYPATAVPEVSLLQDGQGRGLGALVSFVLGAAADRGLTETVIHFRWSGGAALPPRTRIVSTTAELESHAEVQAEQDAERKLRDLKAVSGYKRPAVPGVPHLHSAAEINLKPTVIKTKKYRLAKSPTHPTALAIAPNRIECGNASFPCQIDTAKRDRSISMWQAICAGLNGNYPEDKYPGITKLCSDPRLK
jgi:hypothetical protein